MLDEYTALMNNSMWSLVPKPAGVNVVTGKWTYLKEICPRGNNKVVIYISLYHDKCLLFMLELY